MILPPAYATLIVRIGKTHAGQTHAGKSGCGIYRVDISAHQGLQRFRGGALVQDPKIMPWIATDSLLEDAQRLTAWFLADAQTALAWQRAHTQEPRCRIFLQIDDEAPELHALPWELLGEVEGNHLCAVISASESTPFSRLLVDDHPPGQVIEESPIRILTAIANPVDLPGYQLAPINRTDHQRVVADALNQLDPEQFHWVDLPEPISLVNLEQELTRNRYHILHIVAHGQASPGKPAHLYLADQNNQVDPDADEDALVGMLSRIQQPGLVFLGCCEGAKRDTGDAFRGLAPKLVMAGVPAVLAMQEAILDAHLRELVSAFYADLFSCGQVDRAANLARAHLFTANMTGRSMPVLFCRLVQGQLLHESILREVSPRRTFEPKTIYVPARRGKETASGVGAGTPAFRIAVQPVTNREYAAFVGVPSYIAHSPKSKDWAGVKPQSGCEEAPVLGISYTDATAYTEWLRAQTGRSYRLPSEAEWEQVMSAGLVSDAQILELTSTEASIDVSYAQAMICRRWMQPRTNRKIDQKYRDDVGFRIARSI